MVHYNYPQDHENGTSDFYIVEIWNYKLNAKYDEHEPLATLFVRKLEGLGAVVQRELAGMPSSFLDGDISVEIYYGYFTELESA